ncbi:MAG: hypothetical protein PHX51_08530 [Clostridia bacterium]|nr:hypothetical protein [Clostridia bacterium]
MMNSVFNTTFENSLRIVLLLSEYKISMNVDRITALDFIAINGKTLGLTETDLHGDNTFSSCEYTIKRELITTAIKSLVVKGLITVDKHTSDFRYGITDRGTNFADRFTVDYAREYVHAVRLTKRFSSNRTEQKLIDFINRKTIERFGDKDE